MDRLLEILKQDLLPSMVEPLLADWSSVLGRLSGIALVYILGVCAYRLTLHPFAKYPGPFIAKLTDWNLFFIALGGNRHLHLLREHEQYGPIVRIGPNKLSFNSLSSVKALYANRSANVLKGEFYRPLSGATGVFAVRNGDKKLIPTFGRRALEHALSDKGLREVEHNVVDAMHVWCRHLGEGARGPNEWSPAKDMKDWSIHLTHDIMGDMTYGQRFGHMENEKNRHTTVLLTAFVKFAYIIGHLPILNLVWPLRHTPMMALFAGEAARENQRYIEYSNGMLDERIRREKENPDTIRKDIMHYLFNARDPKTGRGYSMDELQEDSRGLIVAGTDTTAITIAGALFYFLHNPDVLKKALDEIRNSFASVEEINGLQSVSKLVYLRSCIDETIRMSPAVVGMLPRRIQPGGLVMDGQYFPEGTELGVAPYSIQHNEEYYPDSFSFIPERWIVDPKATEGIQTQESVNTAREALFAFGFGVRGCVGKNLAYLEMMLAFSILLFQYDIRLSEDPAHRKHNGGGSPDHHHWGRRREGEYQLIDRFTGEREGPMVEFRARRT